MTFLIPGFLIIKRGQGEAPQLGQPAEQRQKSQAKMYPQPQIHHRVRVQGQRLSLSCIIHNKQVPMCGISTV